MQALKADPRAFRPLLLQARIATDEERFDDAIALYEKIADAHPAFIGEFLEPMHAIFTRCDRQEDWFDWLREIYDRKKNLSVLLQITSEIAERDGFATATDYLTSELSDAPKLAGVHRLIRMRMAAPAQGTVGLPVSPLRLHHAHASLAVSRMPLLGQHAAA